eukprot:35156-Pleurochrysis_carterae.AAC.1
MPGAAADPTLASTGPCSKCTTLTASWFSEEESAPCASEASAACLSASACHGAAIACLAPPSRRSNNNAQHIIFQN